MESCHAPYRWYGRRSGKKMTPQRRQELQKTYHQGGFPWWNPSESLESWSAIHMEIGFGQGEHMIEQARRHPNTLFIGCEAFQDGVYHLWSQVTQTPQHNIRIFPQDVRLLIDQCPDAFLQGLCILFPDPWPKKKHEKRRILHPHQRDQWRRLLKQGATLHVATDHDAYAQAIQQALTPEEGFVMIRRNYALPSEKTLDAPITRYEQKALARKKPCYYFTYEYCRDSGSARAFQEPHPSAQQEII